MSNILESNKTNISTNNKIPNLKEFIKYLDQTLKMFDQHIAEEEFENKNSDVHKLFVTLFNIYTDLDSKKTKENINKSILNEEHKDESVKQKSINTTNIDTKDIDINSIIEQHIENRKNQKKDKPKWENNRTRLESEKIAREIYKKSLLELQTSDDNGPILFTNTKKSKNDDDIVSNILNTVSLHTKTKSMSQPNAKSCKENIKNKDIKYKSVVKKSEETIQKKTYRHKNNKKYVVNNDANDNIIDNDIENIYVSVENKKSDDNNNSEYDNFNMYTDTDENSVSIVHSPPRNKTNKKHQKTHKYEKTDDIDKKINVLKKILNK
ncbi:putative ORFan [Tupanvirus deep ocean]|uniref:ORFan n=2 Tax=Tupanvirus TaxID=2094720 RepID=A0AC62A986_9VIRU|nr:putative ORFan [Tupanvirus deep ocean]QKU34193.1 putative ORFan [Tupanvirus deep ocean]